MVLSTTMATIHNNVDSVKYYSKQFISTRRSTNHLGRLPINDLQQDSLDSGCHERKTVARIKFVSCQSERGQFEEEAKAPFTRHCQCAMVPYGSSLLQLRHCPMLLVTLDHSWSCSSGLRLGTDRILDMEGDHPSAPMDVPTHTCGPQGIYS